MKRFFLCTLILSSPVMGAAIEWDSSSQDQVMIPSQIVWDHDGFGFDLSGALLYWRAYGDHLEYTADTSSAEVCAKSAKQHYTSGFRVQVGVESAHDKWDGQLIWSHYGSVKRNQISTLHDELATYFTPSALLLDNAHRAQNQWTMHFDQLDLQLGRAYRNDGDKWLGLHPMLGLRGVKIGQKLTNKYSRYTTPSQDVNTLALRHHLYGPLIGVGTKWGLYKGWSLYGDATGSILTDRYKVIAAEAIDPHLEQPTFAIVKKEVSVCGNIDLSAGIVWDQMLSNERVGISIQLGWELHYFSGLNRFLRSQSSLSALAFSDRRGDLLLEGAILSLLLHF